MLKQYESQTKAKNIVSDKNTNNITDEEAMQETAFKTLLIQMMDTSSNSMMAELMSNVLLNENSYGLNDSLNSMNNFNAIMRGATQSLVKNYSEPVDNEARGVGLTAAKYESNLNPGAISNTSGDYGGKSYGAWQFSSRTGSLDSFISSLEKKDKQIYSRLTEAKAKDGNK